MEVFAERCTSTSQYYEIHLEASALIRPDQIGRPARLIVSDEPDYRAKASKLKVRVLLLPAATASCYIIQNVKNKSLDVGTPFASGYDPLARACKTIAPFVDVRGSARDGKRQVMNRWSISLAGRSGI
jgi:hypothetical protein